MKPANLNRKPDVELTDDQYMDGMCAVADDLERVIDRHMPTVGQYGMAVALVLIRRYGHDSLEALMEAIPLASTMYEEARRLHEDTRHSKLRRTRTGGAA